MVLLYNNGPFNASGQPSTNDLHVLVNCHYPFICDTDIIRVTDDIIYANNILRYPNIGNIGILLQI